MLPPVVRDTRDPGGGGGDRDDRGPGGPGGSAGPVASTAPGSPSAPSARGARDAREAPDAPDARGEDPDRQATEIFPRTTAPHPLVAPPHPLVPPVLAWFDAHRRDLPWRRPGTTPWAVLVSEVMLQQTPVVRVAPAWTAWQERWPGPAELAAAGHDEVLRAWGRLGYPRRALRLHACAVAVVERHGGVLPEDEEALRALPGVGEYTAAAVLAFAHGRRAVVLDTNVRRVLGRALDGAALPAPHLAAGERARAAAVVPADDATAARWSVAVMELGALVCTARAPRCAQCPLLDACAWVAAGRPEDALAGQRRRQAWHGTDRQARGTVMRLLREAVPGAAVEAATIASAWPDPVQLARAVEGLVADGLVEHAGDAALRLPTGRPA